MAVRRQKKKSRKQLTRKMQKNFLLVFMVVVVLFMCLFVRMAYIRVVKGTQYSNAVLSHQSYVNTAIPYKRGTITDRNGVVLATSTPVYNVIFDPSVVLSDEKFKEPTLDALVEAFSLDRTELERILTEYPESAYYVLLKDQPYERIEAYEALRKANHKVIKGVWFETEYVREYPYGSSASHVIGYTNKGDVGTYGIEQYYNLYLNGKNGREAGYYDAELNLVKKVWEAEDGDTIVSTIDIYLQNIVEEKIEEFLQEYSCENIGVVMMDPDTGEIYAMASNRGFDLNDPRNLDTYYTAEEQAAMTDEEQLAALNTMWRNFCVNDTYEPGSTFKLLTVSAGLEENLISSSTSLYCEGARTLGRWTIHCNRKTGHGSLSLTEALMFSCNMAMMDIVQKEGRTLFRYYQEHFGLGSKTGIDLPGEAAGILIDEELLNETELATSSFGQGFNVTMVQMLSAYCSLVNGGYYYQPHVVKEIVDTNGATVLENKNSLLHCTVSNSTSEFIRQAAYLTVESGTATPAQVEGYLIGGKTGTAQKGNREEGKYVVSFIGGAPADDPEICIYVVIDEIHDETLYNSSKPATQLTSNILAQALPYLGIYPDGDIDYGVEYTGEQEAGDEVIDGLLEEGGEAEVSPTPIPE